MLEREFLKLKSYRIRTDNLEVPLGSLVSKGHRRATLRGENAMPNK